MAQLRPRRRLRSVVPARQSRDAVSPRRPVARRCQSVCGWVGTGPRSSEAHWRTSAIRTSMSRVLREPASSSATTERSQAETVRAVALYAIGRSTNDPSTRCTRSCAPRAVRGERERTSVSSPSPTAWDGRLRVSTAHQNPQGLARFDEPDGGLPGGRKMVRATIRHDQAPLQTPAVWQRGLVRGHIRGEGRKRARTSRGPGRACAIALYVVPV